MTDFGLLLGALTAGIILGTVFFGGLWWTVNRMLTATTPAVWFGVSALARMAVLVLGLYCFARLGLPTLVACLVGVLVARTADKHFARSTA